ncbi:MAG: Tic20 family protein [Microcoleaceae cyanobacterium]
MTWRGSTTWKDRILSCLPYLLPLYYSLQFGGFLFRQFPILRWITVPLLPIDWVFRQIPFGLGPLLVFLMIYMLVVRNTNILHFIRFNAMQAILLDIILFLCSIILGVFFNGSSASFIQETLFNVVFLGTLAAVSYSVVQSIRGQYAEIPTISDAAYMQVQ